MPTPFARRDLLLAALLASSGCVRPGTTLAPCPDDPSQNFGVNWIPDVGRPVAWGEEHLTPQDGAPMTMSIYYPSARFLPPRPMLRQCAWRFPLVLLLHGQSPDHNMQDYHRRWWRIAVALARSGHVVVVPLYAPNAATAPDAVQPAVDWVSTVWEGAPWVNRDIAARAVVGHSYGGLLAARYAAAYPGIGAMAALGGVFSEDTNPPALIAAVQCPMFLMFASDNPFEDFRTSIFAKLEHDHYLCAYKGEHFDYLDSNVPGIDARGPCDRVKDIAADLVALFVGAQLHAITPIAPDFSVPAVSRTPAQEALAIQFLQAQGRIKGDKDCEIQLEWTVAGESGERTIAP